MIKKIFNKIGYFLLIFGISSFIFMQSGCGLRQGESEAASMQASGTTGTETTQEIRETTPVELKLIVGYSQEPVMLNPFIVGGDNEATRDIVNPILLGLMTIDDRLKYVPVLVDEVPSLQNSLVTESPFSVTYRIKKNAVWSDGTPLTSADVKFTWETIMNPKNFIASREGYEKIRSIETPDEKTVVVNYSEVYPAWKSLFNHVLPKHWLEGKDFNTVMNHELIGSGPFVFKEWVAGDHISLEKNPNFWGEDKPKLEMIVFRFIPQVEYLLTLLEVGDIDMIILPEQEMSTIEKLESMGGISLVISNSLKWEHLGFCQLRDTPLKDVNVRKAISYAIDRNRIVDQLFTGRIEVSQSFYNPLQSFYEPAWQQYEFNKKTALGLMAEAGYGVENPIDLKFTTTVGNPLRDQVQTIIQGYLRQIGVNVQIENFNSEELFTDKFPNGDFEIGELAWTGTSNPDVSNLFSSKMLPDKGGQNYYYYQNQQVTDLLDSARYEVDDVKRDELYIQVQRIMADDAIILPLFQHIVLVAYNDKLGGTKVNPSEAGLFWNTQEWYFGN
ncbi:MAG: peptide ABC transporter substrate-binding protein [Actinobacteria bacterium]|nr:peptide ABC transporter substrate-binding protein [Actinomycetota bacterium]